MYYSEFDHETQKYYSVRYTACDAIRARSQITQRDGEMCVSFGTMYGKGVKNAYVSIPNFPAFIQQLKDLKAAEENGDDLPVQYFEFQDEKHEMYSEDFYQIESELFKTGKGTQKYMYISVVELSDVIDLLESIAARLPVG